jgi:pyruvate kinase
MMCAQRLSSEHMVSFAESELRARGVLKPGDVLGVVAGTRQASGSTNFMRLHAVTADEAAPVQSRTKPGRHPQKL